MRQRCCAWSVALTVEGLNLERFLRMAGAAGIRVRRVARPEARVLSLLVRADQAAALEKLAAEGGWQVIRRRTMGAGRIWRRAAERRELLFALLAACLVLAAASRMMWRVEIVDGGPYEQDLHAYVRELGIRAPCLKRRVDLQRLQEAVAWRYPRVAWVECGWRGTTLTIRLIHGMIPGVPQAENQPCDVVAKQDAIIQTVVTGAGTPLVQPGDFVRAGDVLIRGEERTTGGELRQVAARGTVTARIWKGAAVRMSAKEVITRYTGRTETVWTVRSPWFDLWPVEPSSFEHYDTAVSQTALCGMYVPLTICREVRLEAERSVQSRDPEAVREEAQAAAMRKLQEKLTGEESLIDIWGNCSMIDDETVLSVAIGEMLVDIGMQRSNDAGADTLQTTDGIQP